ncbi:SAF domain-containing protein [Modestobacter lapidis]|nr:flagellar biosynthesis protein FlgA [Modestobacter lapidis]
MTRTQPQVNSTPASSHGIGLSRAPVLAPPRRRRRPALLALAVVMVVLGALGAAYLATSLGQSAPVIAVARPVPWGQPITAADLVEARVPVDPALAPISYGDRERVIGMVAATELLPGSLLTQDAVIDRRLPAEGQQLVGVGVSSVQVPTTPLRPGQPVLLVSVGAPDSTAKTAAVAPDPVPATVLRVGPTGTDGRRVVDALVDETDGPDVAARAAAGAIAVVVVSDE